MSAAFDPYHKWLGISPEEQPADYYRLLAIKKFESDPDVIESAGTGRSAAKIKTHHNVGGLPEDMQFTLVEPLHLTLRQNRDPRPSEPFRPHRPWPDHFSTHQAFIALCAVQNQNHASLAGHRDLSISEMVR